MSMKILIEFTADELETLRYMIMDSRSFQYVDWERYPTDESLHREVLADHENMLERIEAAQENLEQR